MEREKYKAFNFDLDTSKLKQHFKNYTDAYKILETQMKKYDFEHRQGSGYVSKKKLSSMSSIAIIKRLSKDNPWLAHCVKKFDVTDIGKTFDLTYILRETSDKTDAFDKLPESITNKLISYQRDNMLRGEAAATLTLNKILDRPFNSTEKVNTAQSKKASDTPAKRSKKSKGKGKS